MRLSDEVPAQLETDAPSIVVRGLAKRFGTVAALRGVDLEIAPSEVVVLLGENGAGKSTLLRILGTSVLPDEGSAAVAGHDVVAEASAVRRSVGLMLGDERSWYWRLTGRQNLAFFARLHGLPRREARARAQELLTQFGLTHAADRRFGGYSAGMRARLSLARALITEPRVLLLDEPTRNLDPTAATKFRAMITSLAQEQAAAVLFATHDLHEAAAVAARVVGLAGGRVAFVREHDLEAKELEQLMLSVSR